MHEATTNISTEQGARSHSLHLTVGISAEHATVRYMLVSIYVYVSVCLCVYNVCVCMGTYICVYVYILALLRIYIHIHCMYVHACIHTYKPIQYQWEHVLHEAAQQAKWDAISENLAHWCIRTAALQHVNWKLRQGVAYIRTGSDGKDDDNEVSHKSGEEVKQIKQQKQNKKSPESHNNIGMQDGALHRRSDGDVEQEQLLCAEMVSTLRDSCNVRAVADVILTTTASANPDSDIKTWMRGDSDYWHHEAEMLRGIRLEETKTASHAHDSANGLNEARLRTLLDGFDAYLVGAADRCAHSIAAARESARVSVKLWEEKRAMALARHMRKVTKP